MEKQIRLGVFVTEERRPHAHSGVSLSYWCRIFGRHVFARVLCRKSVRAALHHAETENTTILYSGVSIFCHSRRHTARTVCLLYRTVVRTCHASQEDGNGVKGRIRQDRGRLGTDIAARADIAMVNSSRPTSKLSCREEELVKATTLVPYRDIPSGEPDVRVSGPSLQGSLALRGAHMAQG